VARHSPKDDPKLGDHKSSSLPLLIDPYLFLMNVVLMVKNSLKLISNVIKSLEKAFKVNNTSIEHQNTENVLF